MSTAQAAAVGGQAPTLGGDPRIAKALEEIGTILVPGETVEVVAVQRRLFALTHRRLIVAATSGRLIGMARRLFGGFQLQDVRWQDVKEVHLRVGMLGADLAVRAFASQDLAVQESATGSLLFHGLDKQGTEQVYRVCQANSQAWREKRRQRDLEEMRARAGGVQIGSAGVPGSVAATGAPDDELVARLQRAKEMLGKGLINDAEYEAIKAKVLGTL